jgi:hypothetical protein
VSFLRRDRGSADPTDIVALGRELTRLDPWSFWTVQLEPSTGAAYAVLGTTGAFAVAPSSLEGYLVAQGRDLVVDGARLGGLGDLRRAAKWLAGRLTSIGASSTDVLPLLVLMRAVAGAPRDHRGVRVVRPEDIVREITSRDRVLDPSTAERLAGRLGPVLARPATGDAEDG